MGYMTRQVRQNIAYTFPQFSTRMAFSSRSVRSTWQHNHKDIPSSFVHLRLFLHHVNPRKRQR